MKTPGSILYFRRTELGIRRRVLAEGLCSSSLIAQYELGYLVPSDEKAALLCERLGLQSAYFLLVLQAHRILMNKFRQARLVGDFAAEAKLFRELAKRETVPVVTARYEYWVKKCWEGAVKGWG